jgi:cupin 2 domain-containing protein
MAEADLQQFLAKVAQLNGFVALSEQRPELRQALRDCRHHQEVVRLARQWGFEIGRRWGEQPGREGDGTNLLCSDCPAPGEERVDRLLEFPGLRLERIHSCEASSPARFWYNQQDWEWVCLLQGSARLRFETEAEARDLNRGDAVLIAPHQRHRLEATDPAPGTILLALFWPETGFLPFADG